MRTSYDRVILGCSAFAAGFAARDPENTLILEEEEFFGGEFSAALRRCAPVRHPAGGGILFEKMLRHGVTDETAAAEGIFHLPAVGLLLNRILLEKGVKALFRTRVIQTERTPRGAEITAVFSGRIYRFSCRVLIDTRSDDFARIRALDPGARFSLSANLFAPLFPEKGFDGMKFFRGYLPGEAYLSMPVDFPSEGDRKTLLSRFTARPEAFRDFRLLAVAQLHSVECRAIREKTETGFFVPSASFSNPVEAFEAGWKEAEK